jgi:hypothetical protein
MSGHTTVMLYRNQQTRLEKGRNGRRETLNHKPYRTRILPYDMSFGNLFCLVGQKNVGRIAAEMKKPNRFYSRATTLVARGGIEPPIQGFSLISSVISDDRALSKKHGSFMYNFPISIRENSTVKSTSFGEYRRRQTPSSQRPTQGRTALCPGSWKLVLYRRPCLQHGAVRCSAKS